MKCNKLNKFTHRDNHDTPVVARISHRCGVNFCLKCFTLKSIKSRGCEWKLHLIVIARTNESSRSRIVGNTFEIVKL